MLNFTASLDGDAPLRLLCIGAHSDDLEIGCGGTLMSWLESSRPLHVTWVVLSATGERAAEAKGSATELLRRAASVDIVLGEFADGFLPSQYEAVKGFFESLKRRASPDIVLTHRLEDRHQDHRLAAELSWNTWRDHVILEYEILKYEGDLGQPNVFVPLTASTAQRKSEHLLRHFGSQRSKSWFADENFVALARLRGLECRSPSGLAEAFHGRKLRLAPQWG
ncbi:PIG-L family deacetylase [Piscinibacter sp. XHJ-5]|uniref:PIG-L deacetylase family protein n=1 Tax=Piscinibacter sp. XHJ-5 TaxID=3037797 RepID=UPI0024537398|nr:PIG-L family deacetylase [Piscinibacter sp. XHJ-5]